MSLVALVSLLALYLFIDSVSEAAWRAARRLRGASAPQGCSFDGLLDELHRVAPLEAAPQPVLIAAPSRTPALSAAPAPTRARLERSWR